jgi:hypothetical protein
MVFVEIALGDLGILINICATLDIILVQNIRVIILSYDQQVYGSFLSTVYFFGTCIILAQIFIS